MHKNIKPILVTGLGLVAIMASWACLPPMTIVRVPVIVTPTLTPGPVASTPAPNPEPSGGFAPRPVSSLAPNPGRTYNFRQTGTTTATLKIEITTVSALDAVFTLTTTPDNGQPTVQKDLKALRGNGIFWVNQGPNPVTNEIATYPSESLTVPFGTYTANKVTAGNGDMFWFVDGVQFKSVSAGVTTELVSIQ